MAEASASVTESVLINNTTEAILLYRLYVVVGVIVILSNIIVLLTFCSSRKLLSKYQMLVALAIADILVGLGLLINGWYRVVIYGKLPDTPLPNSTTVGDCLLFPSVPLSLIGAQWPAIICLLIGVERSLAVYRPTFYRVTFTDHKRLLFVATSAVVVLLSACLAYILTLFLGDTSSATNPLCALPDAFIKQYFNLHRTLIIGGHFFGFLLSVVAYWSATKQSRQANELSTEMRAERKRVGVFLAVTGCSLLLIGLPNLLLWGVNELKLFSLPLRTTSYSLLTFSLNSCINLFVYVVFRSEFRSRLLFLFSCGRVTAKANAAVHVRHAYVE